MHLKRKERACGMHRQIHLAILDAAIKHSFLSVCVYMVPHVKCACRKDRLEVSLGAYYSHSHLLQASRGTAQTGPPQRTSADGLAVPGLSSRARAQLLSHVC